GHSGRARSCERHRGGRARLRTDRGPGAERALAGLRICERYRLRRAGGGARSASERTPRAVGVIAREDRLPPRLRRSIFALTMVPLAYVILAPLTSIDAAQQAGLPLLTDKVWFRIVTTVLMFVVLASAWNIVGGLTGYASFGNIAFFGLGAYTVGALVANRGWPFGLALLAAAGLAVLTTWVILRTRFGYGLLAIRENEEAAAVIGVNTNFYKVAAFCIAAALSGIAGGIFAQWNSFINQELVFAVSDNVQMILMAVLGGAGTA